MCFCALGCLARQLGLFDSIMMMVGIVIGSGIFLTTGIMAQSIPSASLILLASVCLISLSIFLQNQHMERQHRR